MTRTIVTVALTALFVPGCSLSVQPTIKAPEVSTATPPRAVSHGELKVDPPPVHLEYEVAKTDSAHTVLLGGQSELDLVKPATIEKRNPHETTERLRLATERAADGKVLVRIDWEEQSNEGREIRWTPMVSLAPGAVATVSLDLGGGEGRRVTISARPGEPVKARAEVVSRVP